MHLTKWAADALSTMTPDFLIDSNNEGDKCIAFFYDLDGRLYLSEPGQYHAELQETIGINFNDSADSLQALAGRFGPTSFDYFRDDDDYDDDDYGDGDQVASLTVPVVCFYPSQDLKIKSLIKPCLRKLAEHLDPESLVCQYGQKPVPLSSFFGGKVKNTYSREMTKRGLLAPGHSIRAMSSESFDDKLSAILESL